MKKSPIIILMCLASTIVGMGLDNLLKSDKPNIDLPEEYRLIKPTDNLKGEWRDGVLCIEFNNPENR